MIKKIQVTKNQLEGALKWVHECVKTLPETLAMQIELAVEEAIVNVMTHTLQNEDEKLEMVCRIEKDRIEFELSDCGPHFNPLEIEIIPSEAPLEKRKEGGLGILLMRKYMDKLHYIRVNNCNVLTLVKFI